MQPVAALRLMTGHQCLGIGRMVELNTEEAINIEALVEQLASPGG